MPLQSSGIIVVDKTSVITTASTSVAAPTSVSGRANGIYGNIGGGNSGVVRSLSTNRVDASAGVVHNSGIQEWQPGENEYTSVHAANVSHNLIRRNQRGIAVPVSMSSKTASITTNPVSNTSQYNSSQMSQLTHHQQQQLHQVQHSRQQQQQTQSPHHHQTAVLQRTQPGQVIVSEDFLEHATFSSNSNAAGSANVINITANDLVNSTQIIKLVSDGSGGNVLIDSLGNVTNGGHIHNSKLLVGNLTVLSKQPSSNGNQSTFNFVNAKGISYLTSAKSQSPQPQGPPQQQIHHIAGNNVSNASGNPTATTLVQKMGVPRNVQVVTRVQAINTSTAHQQLSQTGSGVAHLQQNVQSTQVIMQQKYVQNIANATAGTVHTNMKVNSSGAPKKQISHNSNKLSQPKGTIGAGQKNHSHQQQLQHQTMQLPSPQQQQQHQQQQSLHTIGMQQASHATIKPVRSSQKIVRKVVGNSGKSSAAPANTKYIMQSPIVLANATNNQMMSTKVHNSSNTSGSIVVPQQVLNDINKPGCGTPGGGAIKFVNAHGAVIQSHHSQSAMQTTVQTQPIIHAHLQQGHKMRGQSGKIQNNQNHQPLQQHYSQATTAVVTNEGILIPAYVNSSQNSSNGEEIMINGTQMTEEMSARILQSLSQKSIYNSIRQYQQHPPQQQQQKIIQQQSQQASPQSTNLVFEGTAGISSRDYTISKQQPGLVASQQAQGVAVMQQQKIITTSNVVYESSNREYGVCKTTTLHHHHPQQQPQSNLQHQQKIIQQSMSQGAPSLSVPTSVANIVYESQSSRHYPHHHQQQQNNVQQHQYRSSSQQIHHHQQQQHAQQQLSHALPQRRAQSSDRKYGGGHGSKRSTDYFKVNTNEILSSYSSPTTFIDNIPLPSPIRRDDNAPPVTQPAEHEDDYMGVEVRPTPVSTDDEIVKALHAILQDHTYVAAMPIGLPLELYQQQQQHGHHHHHQQLSQQPGGSGALQEQSQHHLAGIKSPLQQQQQPHMGIGVANTVLTSTAENGIAASAATIQLTTTNSLLTSGNLAVYPYNSEAQHNIQQRDDDANSVISNESRHGNDGLDNDLGEETETAPEAEAEDDSVTRCICDLTHDDGYMICCDKCSAWQHVECMGIDSSNIPDEYLCEVCQPRPVDRARAKTLQLLKRKEQTQLLMSAQMNTVNTSGTLHSDGNGQFNMASNVGQDRMQPLVVNTTGVNAQNNVPGKKGKIVGAKKKELLKRVKKERSNGKRRESKRTTKRKTKTNANTETSATEKQAQNLRQYIENYELAMTNHYSPELRARLLGVTKQMPSFVEQKIARNAHSADKCSTVPHAGGKILISNLDIHPNSPIIELRGKYMLATQYKNQNPSINMNHHMHNGLQKNLKVPGPFIFFHRLSTDPTVPEICVDTRTYGNEARFVRRSCRPNAEVQHSFEKGTIHLWIVSLTNIMASTEITIRHEPHDLIALDNKQPTFSVTPTSTVCACGLTKDCPFATGAVHSAIASCTKATNKKVVINGASGSADGKHSQHHSAQSHSVPPSCLKKSMQNNVSRGRSTSSSGESNTGLLSPNGNFTNVYNMTSVSMLHDSGVYTSSSSPSVSIPSPTHPPTINSPPQTSNINASQKMAPSQPVEQLETPPPVVTPSESTEPADTTLTKSPQKCNSQARKTPVKHARTNSTSEDSSSQIQSTTVSQPGQEDKRDSRKLTREERKMEAIVRAIEKMEKNQQRKQELKQARNSTGGISKRRNSSSPSPKRSKSQSIGDGIDNIDVSPAQMVGQQQAMQSAKKSTSGSLPRKKKRKSSKSYQMQSSQRKRRRSRLNSNDSDMITSEESTSLLSPPLARTTSVPACLPSQGEIAERQKCLLASLSLDSAQISNGTAMHKHSQPLKREEIPLPPLQPLQTVQSLSTIPPPLHPIQQMHQTQPILQPSFSESQNINLHNSHPASMLLTYPMTADQEQTADLMVEAQDGEQSRSPIRLPHSLDEPRTPQTPPIVSSTCMLVEAAVAPLEGLDMLGASGNEFKLPARTKTKKSIMNDWLNQSNEYQDYHQQLPMCNVKEEVQQHLLEEYHKRSPPIQDTLQQQQILMHSALEYNHVGKGIESLVQAADSISDYRRASSPADYLVVQSSDEPENLSMAAKKVEEFIHQNDGGNFAIKEEIKSEPNAADANTNLLLPLHISNNCSGSSSVKKRWLRQAISEECSDEMANVSAASSPTQMCPVPNGFMTPLKKRRLVRECSDIEQAANSPEDLSMSRRNSKDCSSNVDELSPHKMEVNCEEVVTDAKMDIKQEISEADDEVDILNSPAADEEMVASHDNLVKIEPEDVGAEIKVDVEKEETSSNDVKKLEKVEILEQVVPIDAVEEVKTESQLKFAKSSPKVEAMCTKLEANTTAFAISSQKVESLVKEESIVPLASTKSEPVEQEKCESVSDEIADIQKRLHSFHTENIMILQSRNKSKIARSLKQDPGSKSEKKVSTGPAKLQNDMKTEAGSSIAVESKSKRKADKPKTVGLNDRQKKDNENKHNKNSKRKKIADNGKSEEAKIKTNQKKGIPVNNDNAVDGAESIPVQLAEKVVEARPMAEKKDTAIHKSEPPPLVPTTPSKDEQLKIDEKHLQAALTIPNFNRALPNAPIGNYVLNSVEQSYDITALLSAPPPPPPPLTASEAPINITTSITSPVTPGVSSQPPPLHLPYYYNTIYGKPLSSGTSITGSLSSLSTSLLSDYMDTTKTKSLSTLGYISSFGLGLSKSTVGNSSSLATPVTTISTSVTDSTTTSSSSVSSGSTSNSKILTKTACHDPRLNPILTAPEPPPAPRRKLSINEYRKRKQLVSEPGSGSASNGTGLEKQSHSHLNSQGSCSSGNSSFENGDRYDSASNSNDGSYSEKSTDVTKVQFSPAPTLLEQQQEIICERLRSLKSKSGLGSTSALSGLQMDGPLTSSMLLSTGSDSSMMGSNTLSDANCFTLGKAMERSDEFILARRTLRNNSTSSLESISSSSSRRSSYRGTTPVPQQYDGMDSPRRGQNDESAIPASSENYVNKTQHNHMDAFIDVEATTIHDSNPTIQSTIATTNSSPPPPSSPSQIVVNSTRRSSNEESMRDNRDSSNECK